MVPPTETCLPTVNIHHLKVRISVNYKPLPPIILHMVCQPHLKTKPFYFSQPSLTPGIPNCFLFLTLSHPCPVLPPRPRQTLPNRMFHTDKYITIIPTPLIQKNQPTEPGKITHQNPHPFLANFAL